MGMDLVGAGFTRNSAVECDLDAIDRAIDLIPDETLRDEDFLRLIDPSERLYSLDPDDDDFPSDVRDNLKSGAREFDSAVTGHRMSLSYYINGTPLEFVWTGGGSWGDDPYDGWSDLILFVEFADAVEGVAQLAGYVCGGLPDASVVAQYAKGN